MQEERTITDLPPCAIVVMGVSGSGKSTLGAALAQRLGAPFLEGDAFHSAESVAKMRSGRPLADEDRWPWLDSLSAAAGAAVREQGLAVVACSALKRHYRERLAAAVSAPTLFVLLDIGRADLQRRVERRPGHYMPVSLLDSQLDALERPGADERALVLDSRSTPAELAEAARRWAAETLAHSA